MIPILYESTETEFTSCGLGELADALSCTVTLERNGLSFLEMEYPTDSLRYPDIAIGRMIKAQTSHQMYDVFVIESIEYSEDGTVQIYAPQYACLRLMSAIMFTDNEGYSWTKGSGASGDDVLDIMTVLREQIRPDITEVTDEHGIVIVPSLTTRSNISLPAGTTVNVEWGKAQPTAYDVIKAVADALNAEIYWFLNHVVIFSQVGEDTGLEIRYGLNMLDLDAEIDGEPYATAAMPYGSNNLSNLARADTPGVFPFFRMAIADEGQSAANKLAESQTLKTAIKVKFDPYGNALNADVDSGWLNRLGVCDIVTICHPQINLRQKTKIVKAKFNTLTERFESVDIGEITQDITDTIAALVRGK